MLPGSVLAWVVECVALCDPRDVHIMDGSDQEARDLKVNSAVSTMMTSY